MMRSASVENSLVLPVQQASMRHERCYESLSEVSFDMYNKYLNEILGHENDLILSLGGGTPCYADNMEVIKNRALSFYLKASIDTLCTRLRNEKDQRPLIASLKEDQLKEFVAKHLFERRNFYEQANSTITIDHKTIEELLEEILQSLKA